MTDPNEMFDQAGGGSFDAEELHGSLLVIWPTEVETDVPTVHGDADAVRANILVVDGEKAGEYIEEALIFPRILVSSLRGKVGRQVLGRLGQGEAKRGQSAPWILEKFTDEEAVEAAAAVRAFHAGEFATAETAEEPPAKAAPKTAAKPSTAKTAAAKKVVIPDGKRALAETLLASQVPEEAIAAATGFSVEDLRAAEILPH